MYTGHKISTEWNQEAATHIRTKLIEYNASSISESLRNAVHENICLVIKDQNDNILGGLTGQIYWNRLHVDILWLDDSLRGQGLGSQLLQMAEQHALAKGCKMIKLDTFSFQAPEFYQKLGYKVYGTLENDPEGFTHYYLYKNL